MTANERLILLALDAVLRTLAQVPESRGIVDRAHADECASVAADIDAVLREWDDARREADAPNYEPLEASAEPAFPCPGPAHMTAVERAAATADRRARAYAAAHDADPSMLARGD